MSFRRLIFILGLCALWSFTGQSFEYKIKMYHYLTKEEISKINSYPAQSQATICCEFPTSEESLNMRAGKFTKLIIETGHFPNQAQLSSLETINVPFEIHVSEAFPSDLDISILNNSKVSLLRISSRDFPMPGEVEAINKFKIPVRFDILKTEWPLPIHMRIINLFNPEITVGFYNRMTPGPGQVDFFNNLRTRKVFVVGPQFPYGEDYTGVNLLKNSLLELNPDEKLMPQDILTINMFSIAPYLVLDNSWPLDADFLKLAQKAKVSVLEIKDPGFGDLLKEHFTNWALQTESINSDSKVVYKLDAIY